MNRGSEIPSPPRIEDVRGQSFVSTGLMEVVGGEIVGDNK